MVQLTEKQHIALQGCGHLEQYCRTRYGYEEEQCFLCRPPDAWSTEVFFVGRAVLGVLSEYPVDHARVHALVFPRRHVTDLLPDLAPSEWSECLEALRSADKRYHLRGGGLMARFGDPRLNRGTIMHFHMNVVEPSLTGEVRLPLAKPPAHIERNRARASKLADVYDRMVAQGKLQAFLAGDHDPPEGRHWNGRGTL